MTNIQGTSLLKKNDQNEEDIKLNPLTAFISAESTYAASIIRSVHQTLLAIHRSLKSDGALPAPLLELALDIVNINVMLYIFVFTSVIN